MFYKILAKGTNVLQIWAIIFTTVYRLIIYKNTLGLSFGVAGLKKRLVGRGFITVQVPSQSDLRILLLLPRYFYKSYILNLLL
jgi:hypothetical protein